LLFEEAMRVLGDVQVAAAEHAHGLLEQQCIDAVVLDVEQAQRAREELLRQRPDFSLAFVRKYHLITDPGDMAHYLEGLRKAGIGEN